MLFLYSLFLVAGYWLLVFPFRLLISFIKDLLLAIHFYQPHPTISPKIEDPVSPLPGERGGKVCDHKKVLWGEVKKNNS